MYERTIELTTGDGTLDTFVCHPEEEGPHPAVIIYMDAPGIRDELRDMARRLGTVGYYVLLPNLYYRIGTEDNYGFDASRIRVDPDERARMSAAMASLTPAAVIDDSRILLEHIYADDAATWPIGCVGYCMSGPFVLSVAAAYPKYFTAIAALHGVNMVTNQTDSPHLGISTITAEVYLGFAENDEHVKSDEWHKLGAVLTDAGVTHLVEVYPGTGHGFVFPERALYVKEAAERHWERLFALFRRRLQALV